MVAPISKFYILYTVLFHKDGGANVAVTNCMSQFSIFFPTKATVKLDNVNTGHAQGIGIVLCSFPNCLIIYPVFQVTLPILYHQVPSSFILVFKRLYLNLLNIVTFLTLKVVLGDHSTRLAKILTIFNSKLPRSIITETRIFLSQLSVERESLF